MKKLMALVLMAILTAFVACSDDNTPVTDATPPVSDAAATDVVGEAVPSDAVVEVSTDAPSVDTQVAPDGTAADDGGPVDLGAADDGTVSD